MNQEQIFQKRLKIRQNVFAVQNITEKTVVSRILCGMDILPDLRFHGKNCGDGPKAGESFMHCRSITNLIFSKLEFKVLKMWLTCLSFKSRIIPLLEQQKVKVCKIALFPTLSLSNFQNYTFWRSSKMVGWLNFNPKSFGSCYPTSQTKAKTMDGTQMHSLECIWVKWVWNWFITKGMMIYSCFW